VILYVDVYIKQFDDGKHFLGVRLMARAAVIHNVSDKDLHLAAVRRIVCVLSFFVSECCTHMCVHATVKLKKLCWVCVV